MTSKSPLQVNCGSAAAVEEMQPTMQSNVLSFQRQDRKQCYQWSSIWFCIKIASCNYSEFLLLLISNILHITFEGQHSDSMVRNTTSQQEGPPDQTGWPVLQKRTPPSPTLSSTNSQKEPYHVGRCIGSVFYNAGRSSWKHLMPAALHSFQNWTEKETEWVTLRAGFWMAGAESGWEF